MEISEYITKEQYREIQTFYFYKKRHRVFFIALIAFLGIGIDVINIVSTKSLSVGAVVFMVAPFITIPLTNYRIKSAVDGLYERDIKEWLITITENSIEAKPNKSSKGLIVAATDWKKAYELKSVILLYFSSNQFITISKSNLSDEGLMKLKGIIYDVLGNRFHLRKKK